MVHRPEDPSWGRKEGGAGWSCLLGDSLSNRDLENLESQFGCSLQTTPCLLVWRRNMECGVLVVPVACAELFS